MRALCLLIFFASPALAADWKRLAVAGPTVAVASPSSARVSHDGGRTFKSFAIPGVRAIAATPSAAFVASKQGVSRMTAAGSGPVHIPVPPASVRSMRAGPGWLMLIADVARPGLAYEEDGEYATVAVFVRQKGRWQQLFKDVPSKAENAMTTLRVGPRGHALASLIFMAGCGGVSIAGGAIWRPDRPAQQVRATHTLWELPSGVHRDWLLSGCEKGGVYCLYSPTRVAQPLPDDVPAVPDDLHVSPRARWVAATVNDAVHVYARTAEGLTLIERVVGRVVAARATGVTLRTPKGRLVRVGSSVEDRGALPADTRALDVDPGGRLFALTADGLSTLSADAGWRSVGGF